MKAILIDVTNAEVKEIQVEPTFASYYPIIGTNVLEAGVVADEWFRGNTLYVDEEGMLKADNPQFYIKGAYQPFAGHGIIVGYDQEEGDDTETKLTVEDVRSRVTFI